MAFKIEAINFIKTTGILLFHTPKSNENWKRRYWGPSIQASFTLVPHLPDKVRKSDTAEILGLDYMGLDSKLTPIKE